MFEKLKKKLKTKKHQSQWICLILYYYNEIKSQEFVPMNQMQYLRCREAMERNHNQIINQSHYVLIQRFLCLYKRPQVWRKFLGLLRSIYHAFIFFFVLGFISNTIFYFNFTIGFLRWNSYSRPIPVQF